MQQHTRESFDLSIHAVVNGSLDMSPGKIAAQTFQACQRLYAQSRQDPELAQRLADWEQRGTKTVVHLAETDHVFQRVCVEAPGALMVDEGVNEVEPGSATVFATFPVSRAELPNIIKHKRLRVWRPREAPVAASAPVQEAEHVYA